MFNNVFKTLAQKRYLIIFHGTFFLKNFVNELFEIWKCKFLTWNSGWQFQNIKSEF